MAVYTFETLDGLKADKLFVEDFGLSGTITLDGITDMFLLTGDPVEVTNMDANYLNVMPDPKGKWGLKNRFPERTLAHTRCYLHNYIAKWKLGQEDPVDLSTFLWYEAVGQPYPLDQIGPGVFHGIVFKRPEESMTFSDFSDFAKSLSDLYAGALEIVESCAGSATSVTSDPVETWQTWYYSALGSAAPTSPVEYFNVSCGAGLTDTIRPP